jgi:hypothetical protein
MAMSMGQRMVPGQRMHTVSIDEILMLGHRLSKEHPPLEHYFSPTRKEKFIKDYLHFINSSLLNARHGHLDLDLYILLVLSFQFIIPLLEIPAEKEMDIFLHILENRYELDDPDINIHFSIDTVKEGMVSEDEALLSFRHELEDSYTGRREVKESVQKRLKQDGIAAIMKWQHTKGITELAEAFGRCIVIPVLFAFMDKKLLGFYRKTTPGILYEVAVPEFDAGG